MIAVDSVDFSDDILDKNSTRSLESCAINLFRRSESFSPTIRSNFFYDNTQPFINIKGQRTVDDSESDLSVSAYSSPLQRSDEITHDNLFLNENFWSRSSDGMSISNIKRISRPGGNFSREERRLHISNLSEAASRHWKYYLFSATHCDNIGSNVDDIYSHADIIKGSVQYFNPMQILWYHIFRRRG